MHTIRAQCDGSKGSEIISQNMFLNSFCKSQFPYKSVNSSFNLVIVKDDLADLWGG